MSLALTLALAANAATVPAAPSGSSIQADFDAASAAVEAKDCARAVPLFEALRQNPKVRPGSVPAGAIAVRLGGCLMGTARGVEGETAILDGVPILERAGATFAGDLDNAYTLLGDAAYGRLDYVGARGWFEKALALHAGADRMAPLARLAKATAFEGGPEPLAYADEGLRLAGAQEKPSKQLLATFHTLHARILLNRGQAEQAYAELKQSLSLTGGLKNRISLSDAAMRGDLALAAILAGRKDDARLYLANTGAGRIAESPFATAVAMALPDCGEATGLDPQDNAVVEFGIAPDGSVLSAQTVYSRGGPQVARAFASAVREWYWRPESLAKIPAFYRYSTRVELRCSTAGGNAPGVMKPLQDRFVAWASTILRGTISGSTNRSGLIVKFRQELAERETAGDTRGQIAAIGILAFIDPRIDRQRLAQLDHAIALAAQAGVPEEVSNTLIVMRKTMIPFERVQVKQAEIGNFDRDALLAAAQQPSFANDPLGTDTLRLLAALPRYNREQNVRTDELLGLVADDSRLDAHHPLRQAALLKLANRKAAAGDRVAAQALFDRTGLTEQQCALIGTRPAVVKTGANSGDFPMEAMRYGFEGWVSLEFDISADGRAVSARPLVAYPPFVFVEAATGMTRGLRYETSFRPGGNVACSANRETIRFGIPGNH